MRFLSLLLLFMLTACASDPDADDAKFVAKLRTQSPQVTGGFSYKQFVVANPGDPELLGDEGVLYISPTMFTDEQLKRIGETKSGKDALDMTHHSLAEGLLNMCFSAKVHADAEAKASAAADYSSLVVTWARDTKYGTKFTLYSWPDAWYDWYLKISGGQVVAEDPAVQHDFGWQSSRIVLTPDPSVDLDKCLHYRDGY